MLIETDASGNRQIAHYGGDSGTTSKYRKGTLYFYNNTMVSYRTDRTTLFRLSTNDERADVRNNIFYVTAAGNTLSLVDATGVLNLTHNWFKPGRVSTFGTLTGMINDDGTSIVGSSPGFRDEAGQDFRLAVDSAAANAGTGLPAVLLPEPAIARQYVKHQGSETRPNDGVFDLGAFELTDGQVPNLAISTSSLPAGTVGVPYSRTLAATGGLTPYAWSIVAGALPGGLSLNAATGAISGTPAVAGSSSFTVQVTDGQTPADVATAALSITVAAAPAPSPLSITTTSLPNGKRNKNYSRTLTGHRRHDTLLVEPRRRQPSTGPVAQRDRCDQRPRNDARAVLVHGARAATARRRRRPSQLRWLSASPDDLPLRTFERLSTTVRAIARSARSKPHASCVSCEGMPIALHHWAFLLRGRIPHHSGELMNVCTKLRNATRVLAVTGLALVPASASAAPLILNGGFEAGLTSWSIVNQLGSDGSFSIQTGTTSPINAFAVPAPSEGLQAAMSDAMGPGSHLLYQDFIVPVGVTAATLSFDLFINNMAGAFHLPTPSTLDFSTPALNQQARVDILLGSSAPFSVAGGDVLQTLYQTNVGDALLAGYFTTTLDLTALLAAHAGQTLRLRFAEVDNVFNFNLGVDNVSLDATVGAVPEPASLALIGAGLLALSARRRLGPSRRRP